MITKPPKSPTRLPFHKAPSPEFLQQEARHDPGYVVTRLSENGRVEEIKIEKPESIHYLQEAPDSGLSYFRCKSGAMFSVQGKLDELAYDIASGKPFDVKIITGTPVRHDVALETLRVLKTNPRAIMIDLSEATGAPMSFLSHPSESVRGIAVFAPLAQFLTAGKAARQLDREIFSQSDYDQTVQEMQERLVDKSRDGQDIRIIELV